MCVILHHHLTITSNALPPTFITSSLQHKKLHILLLWWWFWGDNDVDLLVCSIGDSDGIDGGCDGNEMGYGDNGEIRFGSNDCGEEGLETYNKHVSCNTILHVLYFYK